MLPHIYGLSNDMDKILKIVKKHNLYLIEDAAEVFGLKYKNRYCGSFGDISILSFYANKHITTGEGRYLKKNLVTFCVQSCTKVLRVLWVQTLEV